MFGGLSCTWRLLTSIPGLHALDATSIPSRYDNLTYLQTSPNAPTQQNHPLENLDSGESLPVCVKAEKGEKGELARDWKQQNEVVWT